MTEAARFVRAYLDSIEAGASAIDDWYTVDAVQIEWPNTLTPQGAVRDLDGLREAARRGRQIIERQWYEVVNLVADGDRVAVEAIFRATFRLDLPKLPRGAIMTARFAMFFTLAGGKIRRHTTYDCFLPSPADAH